MENNIKQLLDGRPVTWLSDKTGIPRSTLIPYLQRGVPPKLETADLIAHAFGVTIYEVFPQLKSAAYYATKK